MKQCHVSFQITYYLAGTFQTVLVLLLVALTASSVHEEATEGFEAIRGALRNEMAQEDERMVREPIYNSHLLIGGVLFPKIIVV